MSPSSHKRDRPTCNDWDGPDDVVNPENWSLKKRLYHTAVPTVYAFFGAFGSSVYTPARSAVSQEFNVSSEVALLPFVIYLLGQSLGPIIAAPLSESFGRKITYIVSVPIFGAFIIGAGFSHSIGPVIICRFFAGVFSSVGLAIGAGSISELWPPHRRPIPLSIFASMTQFGPALGDTIGAFVTRDVSWRWTQWCTCFGLAFTLAMMFGMSETYKTTILQRRAKGIGATGPPGIAQRGSVGEVVKVFATQTLVRPVQMMVTEPIVLFLDLYIAFNFGIFNAFFAAFTYVFETAYGFDIGATGLTYIGEAAGTLVGLGIVVVISEFVWLKQAEKTGQDANNSPAPEHRLLSAQIGAPLLSVSLFLFAWTARPSIHWIAPVIGEAIFGCGNLLIFTTACLYLTDCYGPAYGASAWSSTTSLRYLIAFVFPLFATQMYEGLGIGWATSLLAFCELLLVPIPFLFDRYGKLLRQRSTYIINDS